MKKVLSILLALVLTVSVTLIGCAGGEQEEEEEEPYGTLIYAQEHLDKETFIGWMGSGVQNPWLIGPLYETLTFTDRTGQILPMLLTDWEMAGNASTYTLLVRQGVQFHNGWGNVTSADIKYSLERWARNDSLYRLAATLRGLLSRIETPDPYTVVVHLTKAEPLFIHLFGDVIQVVCKAYLEAVGDAAANENPIGTGPYTKKEHVRGSYIELTLHGNWTSHWRVTTPGLPPAISLAPYPHFRNIRVVALPDLATRVQSLKSGLVSFAEMTHAQIPALNNTPGVGIVDRGAFPDTDRIVFGGLDTLHPPRHNPNNPWYDVRVRRAMLLAINKTALLDGLYYGRATPAGSITWAPEWVNQPAIPFDPVQAVQLLNDAGWGGGFPVQIITDGRWMNTDLATVIAHSWRTILGLNATVVTITGGTHRDGWRLGTHGFNTSVWMHRAPGPGADAYPEYSAYLLSGGAICCYADNTTRDLLTAIGAELNWTQRSNLITQLGNYINQKVAVGFLFHVYSPLGYRTELDEPRNVARLFDYLDLTKRK